MRIVLVTVLMTLHFSAAVLSQEIIDESKADFSSDEINVVVKVLGDRLNDPYSAKISGLFRGQEGVICGRINAKNSFGGYVGYAPFYVDTADNGGNILYRDHDQLPDAFLLDSDILAAYCNLPARAR